MAKSKQRRNSAVKSIFGHDAPPQNVVLRGMADLEKTLTRRFQETENQRARLAEVSAPRRDKLLGLLRKDPGWAAPVRRQSRTMRKSLASRHTKALEQKPGAGVFVGFNAGTRLRPFDYSWTWSTKSGEAPPDALDVSADRTYGQLLVKLDAGSGEHGSNVAARAAVGIFFRLSFWRLASFSFCANPIVGFNWQDYCGFDSVHTDGFVGLFAASYNSAGNLSAVLTDQEISLWSDDSWWEGGTGMADYSSFPMSANFLVDSDHWYALWVWCGSHNIGDGWHTIEYSEAVSELFVIVRSISWQFDPLQPPPFALP
jgi:hypothetical protein